MKKIIICILIGIILFAWGTGTSKYTKWDETEKVYNGNIIMEKQASDPVYNVSVESPILYRKVEMYRYIVTGTTTKKKGDDYKEVDDWTIDWTDDTSSRAPSGRSNPKWPENLKPETFYGDVKLAKSGVYLSKEILKHFTYNYVYLKSDHKMLPVINIDPKVGKTMGLPYYIETSFTSTKGSPKIGDIRVTYYAVDPAILKRKYTVTGYEKNNVIGLHEDGHVEDNIYDRVIAPEDLKQSREKSNRMFSIVFRCLGAILIIAPIGTMVILSRKRKNR